MMARDSFNFQQLAALMPLGWHSWWFWLMAASGVVLCSYSVFRASTRNMHRQRTWLEHQVCIRTIEVEKKTLCCKSRKMSSNYGGKRRKIK